MRNNKLSVAVHLICAIEKFSNQGYDVTSKFLANSVNTNPAAIRRTISTLVKAGIIETDKGYHIVNFHELNVYDVQKAVDPEGKILYAHTNSHEKCPVGSKIERTMNDVFQQFQHNVENDMKSKKLSDIIKAFN